MVYVFDSSFAAALVIPDEKNRKTDEFFLSLDETDGIYVPQLWWYEMGNILKNLVRRRRFTYQNALGLVPGLSALNLITDTASGSGYTEKLLRLAHDYDLSAYDAAYLELAGRLKAVLCTQDAGLKAAAGKFGVGLH
ncbi:MAG: type II toxin-antitoxin system VapC family toxin [Spirochaetales bacterium]|jgi:predicted nucleic acid-binding protein|nr:type II toxin-antitoxin system VapC family toxin [Spirochaetales bacterium]